MKNIYLLLLLFIFGCGKEDQRRQKCVMYGDECHENTTEKEDTTPKTVVGPPGPKGDTGKTGGTGRDGEDGYSTLVLIIESETCPNGGKTMVLFLDKNRNEALDSDDANVQSTEICNGEDGNPGQIPPFSTTNILDPCGDKPGIWDEVVLKLSNGTLLASFSDNANGKNTRLSILTPGSYVTTDGDHCTFTVNNLGEITYESHQN